MKKESKSIAWIITVVLVLLGAVAAEIILVFRMTARSAMKSGSDHLEKISGDLEETINAAKLSTLRFALEVTPYLDNKAALKSFIYTSKQELADADGNTGYNLYIAGPDWHYIPDFIEPSGYDPTQRSWYTGALRSGGEAYVTDPYEDAMTGNMCYTVSVMLADGETVVGIDYTMQNIQNHISRMNADGEQHAVIVTGEGIIAGCTEPERIGKNIIREMPDYAGIFSLVKSSDEPVAVQQRTENLFATQSAFGWYLIVSEKQQSLYRVPYIQLFAMVLISLIIFAVIIYLYIRSSRNAKKAEEILQEKDCFLMGLSEQMQEPVQSILTSAAAGQKHTSAEYEQAFAFIREASGRLGDQLSRINTFASTHTEECRKHRKSRLARKITNSKRYRAIILISLIGIMAMCFYINFSASFRFGKGQMQKAATNYAFQLSQWIDTQKSLLDMFSSIISVSPEILDDYHAAVAYLNEIAQQYPEISVCYMVNPELPHTVYMNNGWEPDKNWHVEEREWYRDLMASDENWIISSPYYDEQTGLYCVTMAEKVYDTRTGKWLGNFGIDFYMDKLANILGNSYSDDGYAFLVDAKGEIVSHPNGNYQMTADHSVNIVSTAYNRADTRGERITYLRDYDGRIKALIALRNEDSNFVIYVINRMDSLYKNILYYSILLTIVLTVCTVLVYRIMSSLIELQEEANQKLKVSADKAIAADEAKSNFLAQMSHEIRTPINAVLGMNEMILRECHDPDILEYSQNIQSSGKLLLSLINSILDFSKIEDGKMEIINAPYQTRALISDLTASIVGRADAKGLEFHVHADCALPTVMQGDDVRLRQIIINLLTNAVKYTERGGITLTMRTEERNDKQLLLFVEVADTGIGIKEEDMSALFETFKRLDEKRNRNIEGTGLGMNIVTRLLRMMNSELEVRSVYGKGSAFSFRVWQDIIDEAPIGDSLHITPAASLEEAPPPYAPDAQVLVVDDNEMNIKVAINLLKICGIAPDKASSGFRAMELMRDKRYDIVLMDHMMPRMDGVETLDKLRTNSLIPEGTVVIALTANAIVGAREFYLNAGFDDYLTKPIEGKRLMQALVEHLPPELLKERPAPLPERTPTDSAVQETAAPEDSYTLTEIKTMQEHCPMLNIVSGLGYCMDSREFYLETLQAFLDSDKRQLLSETFGAEDFANYRIHVHAVKSSARTIGADVFSDHARALEFAARDGDTAFITAHHEAFMTEYTQLTAHLERMIEDDKRTGN